MSRTHLKSSIEKQSSTDIRIAKELVDIVEFLVTNGHVPNGPAIKTPDLDNRCPEASYYRVERLHNELGLVQKQKQGPNSYLIHTRKDEIVNGQGVSKMVNEELSRLVDHVKQDQSVRQVVANKRGCSPQQALQNLFQGNFGERRDRLDMLVTAIKQNTSVSQGNYGKIIFRTPANLYRATSLAVQLYRK